MDPYAVVLPQTSDEYPLGKPHTYKRFRVRVRPAPRHAYGFILRSVERRRWAEWFHELHCGLSISSLPGEEQAEAYIDWDNVAVLRLPSLIYTEFKTVIPLRNHLLPIYEGKVIIDGYMFVLRDDACWLGDQGNLSLEPELLEQLRQRLGLLEGTVPEWGEVAHGAK